MDTNDPPWRRRPKWAKQRCRIRQKRAAQRPGPRLARELAAAPVGVGVGHQPGTASWLRSPSTRQVRPPTGEHLDPCFTAIPNQPSPLRRVTSAREYASLESATLPVPALPVSSPAPGSMGQCPTPKWRSPSHHGERSGESRLLADARILASRRSGCDDIGRLDRFSNERRRLTVSGKMRCVTAGDAVGLVVMSVLTVARSAAPRPVPGGV